MQLQCNFHGKMQNSTINFITCWQHGGTNATVSPENQCLEWPHDATRLQFGTWQNMATLKSVQHFPLQQCVKCNYCPVSPCIRQNIDCLNHWEWTNVTKQKIYKTARIHVQQTGKKLENGNICILRPLSWFRFTDELFAYSKNLFSYIPIDFIYLIYLYKNHLGKN